MPFTISVDFDGVLHNYESGWQGYDVVPDGPVPGAMEWLKGLLECRSFEVYIVSSRANNAAGKFAISNALNGWFLEQGYNPNLLGKARITGVKPSAWVSLDDRAICFKGIFPDYDDLINFTPWNRVSGETD